MKVILIRRLLVCSFLFWSLHSFSQETNRKKIIGIWAFSKIEFSKSYKDSLSLMNNSKGMIITFYEDFVTMKNKFDRTIFSASRYTISPDGATFTQDGEAAKIIKLTDEELVMNLEEKGVIEYFKKVH